MENKLEFDSPAYRFLKFALEYSNALSWKELKRYIFSIVKDTICIGMKFGIDDIEKINTNLKGPFYIGKDAADILYNCACSCNNISFCKAVEKYHDIPPFIDNKGHRVCYGCEYRCKDVIYRFTTFNYDKKLVRFVSEPPDEKGKKSLMAYTNKEWNAVRKDFNLIDCRDFAHE